MTNQTAQHGKQLIETFFAVQPGKDINAFAATLHDDVYVRTPYAPSNFNAEMRGKQAVVDTWNTLFTTFGELLIPTYKVWATDQDGLFMATWSVDIETPNGARYRSENIGTLRVKDGLIVEYIEFFNPLRFGKALALDLSADL